MVVIWLSKKEETPARGYWDQRMLERILKNEQHIVTSNITSEKEAIVIIPGAYQADIVKEINAELAKIGKVKVVITSDEENKFPIDELSHPDMEVFATYYNPKYKSDIRWMPIGAANVFDLPLQAKTRDFIFMGQSNSPERVAYVEELKKRTDGFMLITEGFSQGDSPEDYYKALASAKVAPSPAGAVCPDAFRTYEAIHAGAVPIPSDKEWHTDVFGYVPFPVINDYSKVNETIDETISKYPTLNNQVQCWWLQEVDKIKEELLPDNNAITVIVPVSPIKSHPSTEIIDETLSTVRHHMPNSKIIVTFDGVREEQEDRREDYEKFKRHFLWKCYNEKEYDNIVPINFEEHTHQVGMAREALELVRTPLVLYIEQDTPLVTDREIDWKKCIDFIKSEKAKMIRFHFESSVPDAHQHMIIGPVENGFLKTSQWSQRPHLIQKSYYDRLLDRYFTDDAVCFIEDKMHGIVSEDYIRKGVKGWANHKLWIYHPEGSIQRSYHTDGRQGEEKWDDTQVW